MRERIEIIWTKVSDEQKNLCQAVRRTFNYCSILSSILATYPQPTPPKILNSSAQIPQPVPAMQNTGHCDLPWLRQCIKTIVIAIIANWRPWKPWSVCQFGQIISSLIADARDIAAKDLWHRQTVFEHVYMAIESPIGWSKGLPLYLAKNKQK